MACWDGTEFPLSSLDLLCTHPSFIKRKKKESCYNNHEASTVLLRQPRSVSQTVHGKYSLSSLRLAPGTRSWCLGGFAEGARSPSSGGAGPRRAGRVFAGRCHCRPGESRGTNGAHPLPGWGHSEAGLRPARRPAGLPARGTAKGSADLSRRLGAPANARRVCDT